MRIFRKLTTKKLLSIAFFALVLTCGIYFFSGKFFEKNAYDLMIKLAANKQASEQIVNVVINEKSIEEIGSWPWKRTYYADMFDYLKQSGAKVIVFDAILTTQGDEFDDKQFLERVASYKNLVVGVDFSKNENMKNADDLSQIFAEKFSIPVTDKRKPAHINKSNYKAFREMFPGYVQMVSNIGSVNTVLDVDGAVRAFEPIVNMKGKYYSSLPLATYLATVDAKEIILKDNSYQIVMKNGGVVTFPIRFVQDKSVQYIKWLAPYDNTSWVPHKQYEAVDVINSYRNLEIGEAPVISKDAFKDKIVVIGATANALYDLKITPMTINMPGSAIQATAIDNLIAGDSIVSANIVINILIMLLFMALIYTLIYYLAPFISFMSIMVLGFLYFYMALFAYTNSVAINVVTPYIFFIVTGIISYAYRFSVEDYKKEKLKRAMKKYVNTTLVDDIMKNSEEEVKLGGKKTELTILIADMRGFTKISENLDPNEVTNLLNEYFGQMIPIIEQHNGAVNKFIGDAILAVFNEPIKDKRHPQNAIFCATKMLAKVQELKKKWKAEGKPEIGISIGINTGMAFIGNIGTPNHLEYTVIGDTVNVASRIEAQNRKFNTQLLISEKTYEYAKDILDVIRISSVEIRGREKHIDIYEIINILDTDEAN